MTVVRVIGTYKNLGHRVKKVNKGFKGTKGGDRLVVYICYIIIILIITLLSRFSLPLVLQLIALHGVEPVAGAYLDGERQPANPFHRGRFCDAGSG